MQAQHTQSLKVEQQRVAELEQQASAVRLQLAATVHRAATKQSQAAREKAAVEQQLAEVRQQLQHSVQTSVASRVKLELVAQEDENYKAVELEALVNAMTEQHTQSLRVEQQRVAELEQQASAVKLELAATAHRLLTQRTQAAAGMAALEEQFAEQRGSRDMVTFQLEPRQLAYDALNIRYERLYEQNRGAGE